MDPESLVSSKGNAPRKVRFAPKAPPKRDQKPVLPKVEKTENDIDDAMAEQLRRRLNETSLTGRSKVERKGKHLFRSRTLRHLKLHLVMEDHLNPSNHMALPRISTRIRAHLLRATGTEQTVQKEYKEPWDYYTYYPVTLPLRRPYSGDPVVELLDEEEFGEDPETSTYDENETSAAETLGLLEENMEDNMIFLQLPATLPTINPSIKTEDNNANSSKGSGKSQKPCSLEELPAGLMGKMLVYKSGAIKLKLGDTLYDVSAGLECVFAQDVVAINTETKQCCNVGELNKRAVITPDIDHILDSMPDL
ncbi:hypothetical protein BUALT_Bualt09G0039400 [Buddleja alternifolia]|uniref:DNA-directed RNA polymerase III subunit RPC4 n=1 Tax=Buddleja alternifolia TaxID=168488 RepID=A0AAV6XAI3_9LAMI|nr:hypothetical protein BUALT_Bualt09G0039400 [Buddleja alternifolia]